MAAGEIFGLLGPNGAGKTTTVEIVEGLRTPDSGTALVTGLDVQRDIRQVKSRIGVQLQTTALFPALTVVERILSGFERRFTRTPALLGVKSTAATSDGLEVHWLETRST